MGVFVTEHTAWRTDRLGDVRQAPAASYLLSSTTATVFAALQAGTKYVRVSADAGCFLSNSVSTGTSLTSTNAYRIPANQKPELISVSTTNKLIFGST